MEAADSVVIRNVNGKFYAVCYMYNLIAENTELQNAYDELCQKRNEAIQKFKSLNIAPEPSKKIGLIDSNLSKNTSWLFPFLIKTMIIFSLFAIPLLFVSNGVVNTLSSTFSEIRKLTDFKNQTHLGLRLSNLANTLETLSPEKKADLMNSLKTIVKNMKPFTDEIQPILQGKMIVRELKNDQQVNNQCDTNDLSKANEHSKANELSKTLQE